MHAVRRRVLRLLVRSYQTALQCAVRETQVILIVALSVLVWMVWAINRYGTFTAFLMTMPTSLPPLLWPDNQRQWIDRKDERAERVQRRRF
jgi:hypothetical protein